MDTVPRPQGLPKLLTLNFGIIVDISSFSRFVRPNVRPSTNGLFHRL